MFNRPCLAPHGDDGAGASSLADAQFIDRVLADRYRIERRIGGGPLGAVFRAEDRREYRPVAVKIYTADLDPDGDGARGLLADAEAAAALMNPNILPTHDAGVVARHLFLVEPLLAGQSVAHRLEQQGPLPPAAAVRVGLELLLALDAMHRHDLLHLDLKPENVFLVRDPVGMERAVVAGIGQHRLLGLENAGERDGKGCRARPEYLTPEAAAGRPNDARSDLYLVGLLLFEMLTGRPPFTGSDFAAVRRRQVMERPLSPKLVRPQANIPEGLSRLVMACLEKSPAKRPASAAELTRALEEVARKDTGGAVQRPRFRAAALAAMNAGLDSMSGSVDEPPPFAPISAEPPPAPPPSNLDVSALLSSKREMASPLISAPPAARPVTLPIVSAPPEYEGQTLVDTGFRPPPTSADEITAVSGAAPTASPELADTLRLDRDALAAHRAAIAAEGARQPTEVMFKAATPARAAAEAVGLAPRRVAELDAATVKAMVAARTESASAPADEMTVVQTRPAVRAVEAAAAATAAQASEAGAPEPEAGPAEPAAEASAAAPAAEASVAETAAETSAPAPAAGASPPEEPPAATEAHDASESLPPPLAESDQGDQWFVESPEQLDRAAVPFDDLPDEAPKERNLFPYVIGVVGVIAALVVFLLPSGEKPSPTPQKDAEVTRIAIGTPKAPDAAPVVPDASPPDAAPPDAARDAGSPTAALEVQARQALTDGRLTGDEGLVGVVGRLRTLDAQNAVAQALAPRGAERLEATARTALAESRFADAREAVQGALALVPAAPKGASLLR
ncbi:MAG: serine/threonine protein kinase, partial [Myxococcales bacterium]|nr:serine/threonine protein kinase [Myxococcales bacterium]